jgi:hypothetical protein
VSNVSIAASQGLRGLFINHFSLFQTQRSLLCRESRRHGGEKALPFFPVLTANLIRVR